MSNEKSIKVCGLMKTTLLDFPGRIAATVFTPGCNMRCPFCHNPRVVFGKDELIPLDEIYSFLKKRRGVLDGICITGGEPTLWGEALYSFAYDVKSLGYLVKLDTNGTNPVLLSRLLEDKILDYVAMDIKTVPEEKAYARVCGANVDIGKITESIEILKATSVDNEFRTTVVNELHTEGDLVSAARKLCGGKKYFLQHFVDSGDLVDSETVYHEMAAERMQAAARLASEYIPTSIRGI